jgi:(R)-2-hydroxyacyl-CoA dehydratese activating ATPase
MSRPQTAGIDIGSSSVKLVELDEHGGIARREAVAADFAPKKIAEGLLASLPQGMPVAATGYGRGLFDLPSITEIKAHGLGCRRLFPDAVGFVDIGGQDVKVVTIDHRGKAARFEMNDRCAAGTGRFLEIMAARLGYSLHEFSEAALAGTDGVTISSMCTVFAESEVVGLVNRGMHRRDIAAALHRSVAVRIAAMVKRVAPGPGRIVLSGGGAQNGALAAMLSRAIGRSLTVAPDPQMVGALGCALEAGKVHDTGAGG